MYWLDWVLIECSNRRSVCDSLGDVERSVGRLAGRVETDERLRCRLCCQPRTHARTNHPFHLCFSLLPHHLVHHSSLVSSLSPVPALLLLTFRVLPSCRARSPRSFPPTAAAKIPRLPHFHPSLPLWERETVCIVHIPLLPASSLLLPCKQTDPPSPVLRRSLLLAPPIASLTAPSHAKHSSHPPTSRLP